MKKALIPAGVLLLVFIVIGVFVNIRSANQTDQTLVREEVTLSEGTAASAPKGDTGNQQNYLEYTPSTVAAVIAAGKTPVLFFHASWCPTCKAADEDIKANGSQIPENIVIIKTDYDTNTDLKEKFGVTYQHTFVALDENQQAVKKWNGGEVDQIVRETNGL